MDVLSVVPEWYMEEHQNVLNREPLWKYKEITPGKMDMLRILKYATGTIGTGSTTDKLLVSGSKRILRVRPSYL